VRVLFAPDGTVAEARVDTPPNASMRDFRGTLTARCVEDAFHAARIPPFLGSAVLVGKTFVIYPLGPTYEEALAAERRAPSPESKLADPELQTPMRNATFIAACGAPETMKATVHVAVKGGRAVGVSVTTSPASEPIARCIAGAVWTLAWPSDPGFASFTVTY